MNPQHERDKTLARRLTVHDFAPPAIRLGIDALSQSLADQGRKSSLLVMQSLVSRAIANHLHRWGQDLEDDLPEKAAQALAARSSDPLLHAAAMLVGSYSTGNAERVELVIFDGLEISLTPEASGLWETIKTGARPGLREIAYATGLKNWWNHPSPGEYHLHDHCRRVHANPDRTTVIAMANDYASLNVAGNYPLTRKAIVRAAAWGDNPTPLLESLARDFSDYREDILDLLTSEALYQSDRYKEDWLGEMENSVAGVLGLVDLLIAQLSEMGDEVKAEVSERIFAAQSCPWFWLRWRELFRVLPLGEPVVGWVEGWENARDHSSSGTTPPYTEAMRQLGETPLKEVVATLPTVCQAKLAAEYSGPCQHYDFYNAGFPDLIAQQPGVFLPVVQPLVESGNSSVRLLTAVLRAVPDDQEAAMIFTSWARMHTKETEYPADPRDEMEELIEQLKRFDGPLPPRLRNKRGYFLELIRCGYELRPKDVDVLVPSDDLKCTRDSETEYHGTFLWDDDDNARMILSHPWPESEVWVVVRSVLANCQRPKGEGTPEEWLERVLVPTLLTNEAMMHRFCTDAWDRLPGSSHARALLAKEDRINQWMTEADREDMETFVRYNAHSMLGSEAETMRAVYPRERLTEIFRAGCVSKKGGLCPLRPWLDLFQTEPERAILVQITAGHLEGESRYDALGWVKTAGLAGYPAIQHRLQSMLDTEGEQHLVEVVADCLGAK